MRWASRQGRLSKMGLTSCKPSSASSSCPSSLWLPLPLARSPSALRRQLDAPCPPVLSLCWSSRLVLRRRSAEAAASGPTLASGAAGAAHTRGSGAAGCVGVAAVAEHVPMSSAMKPPVAPSVACTAASLPPTATFSRSLQQCRCPAWLGLPSRAPQHTNSHARRGYQQGGVGPRRPSCSAPSTGLVPPPPCS